MESSVGHKHAEENPVPVDAAGSDELKEEQICVTPSEEDELLPSNAHHLDHPQNQRQSNQVDLVDGALGSIPYAYADGYTDANCNSGVDSYYARQMPHVEENEDVEVVQETQDQLPRPVVKRKHRRKGAEPPPKDRGKQIWSKQESLALANAWIKASKDPINANSEKQEAFTATFVNNFHMLIKKSMGYRSEDSINGKWRKMKLESQKFHQIWIGKSQANNHASGTNDADLLEETLTEYKWLTGKATPFAYLEEWKLLRNCSKFLQLFDDSAPTRSHSGPKLKRFKKTLTSPDLSSQSLDARNQDLNASEDDDEDVVEADRTYSRSQGRDNTKKAKKGASSMSGDSSTQGAYADALGKLSANVECMAMEFNKTAEWEMKRVKALQRYNKIQERNINMQERKHDVEIMTADYSYLPPDQRAAMELLQKQILRKYKPSD